MCITISLGGIGDLDSWAGMESNLLLDWLVFGNHLFALPVKQFSYALNSILYTSLFSRRFDGTELSVLSWNLREFTLLDLCLRLLMDQYKPFFSPSHQGLCH